jgi:hypothetical protein
VVICLNLRLKYEFGGSRLFEVAAVLSDGQPAAVYILEVLPVAAVVPGRSDVSGRPRDGIDISFTDAVIS